MAELLIGKDGYESVRYDSPDSLMCIRRLHMSDFSDMKVKRHRHEDVEFILVLSGELMLETEGRHTAIPRGCGVMINSARFHSVSVRGEDCEFILVMLNPAFLCTTKHIEEKYVQPIVHPNAPDLLLLTDDTGYGSEVIDCLRGIYEKYSGSGNSLYVGELYFRIWRLIYENAQWEIISDPPPDTEERLRIRGDRKTLKHMLEFIYEHYAETVTLTDIAAAGNVCRSKCAELFTTYMHESPITFLTGYRLHKALDMLRETDMSVLDIAYAAGFSNSSYFSKIFRARIGCSPSEYRKHPERTATDTGKEPSSFAFFPDHDKAK